MDAPLRGNRGGTRGRGGFRGGDGERDGDQQIYQNNNEGGRRYNDWVVRKQKRGTKSKDEGVSVAVRS